MTKRNETYRNLVAMIFTTVGILSAGCAKTGSDGAVSVSAQNVSGAYAKAYSRVSGETILVYVNFTDGHYEQRTYKIYQTNTFEAQFIRFFSSDRVDGAKHNAVLISETCQKVNNLVLPSSSSFTVVPVSDGKIMLHSDFANQDFILDKIADIDRTLSDMGVSRSVEVTTCDLPF